MGPEPQASPGPDNRAELTRWSGPTLWAPPVGPLTLVELWAAPDKQGGIPPQARRSGGVHHGGPCEWVSACWMASGEGGIRPRPCGEGMLLGLVGKPPMLQGAVVLGLGEDRLSRGVSW